MVIKKNRFNGFQLNGEDSFFRLNRSVGIRRQTVKTVSGNSSRRSPG
jgi:hypothetical protein